MKLHSIETGKFKLDGGAMFGVVPKQLWNRLNPADEKNMCTWAARCLLIEEGDRKILIDTGLGDKQDEKFRSHFSPHGNDNLIQSIRNTGIHESEITDVLLTHFHFDHVGGAVKYDENKNLVPTFPNATYWSNKSHYDWAYSPNYREKASFLKENFVPLKEKGILKWVNETQGSAFTNAISLQFVYGHTEAMIIPFIDLGNGKTLVYGADLIPSSAHIHLPYVMSYDVRPLETLKEKAALYERITDGNHILFFEHDRATECGIVSKNERGRVSLNTSFALSELNYS